jgi:hypothetical protein
MSENEFCHECGQEFVLTESDIAHHLDDDGYFDYGADADHVAYALEGIL